MGWKVSTVDGIDNFRRLLSSLVNEKLTLITSNTHVQEFNCFYRLINKQITSNHIFGIS